MLYAHYLADFITKEVSVVTPELLDSILPSGISSVYHTYFKRLETELCTETKASWKIQFLNFSTCGHSFKRAIAPRFRF